MRRITTLAFLIFSALLSTASCIPYADASKHIGETRCVTGHVFRVVAGARGVHYLDFCEDYRTCPFTVVIFPHDLKNVGDVRFLQGQLIEIHGPVKGYDGKAEIILSESRQLKGGTRLPPLPKNYDVENRGRYSPGSFHASKARKKTKKPAPASTVSFPEDDEPE